MNIETKNLPTRTLNRTRKKHRNKLRSPNPLELCERQPVSHIPLRISSSVLTEPKNKLTNAARKRFLRSRQSIVVAPTKPAVEEPIKFAKRLTRLSLFQVGREIQKAARRAATAKHLLADMSETSMFRPAVEVRHREELNRYRQAIAERNSRIKSA